MATNKQKALAKKLQQNPTITMGQAMKEVGYSSETRPTEVTNSKAWPDLVEKYLPDDEVLDAHKRGLRATKIFTSHTEPDRLVDDIPTQLKAVELAYKIKGKLTNTQINILNQGDMDMGLLIENDKTT